MTNIVRNLGLTSSTMTAGFDNIGQLTSWNATEAGGTPRQNEQLGFGYDAAHNLHTRNNGNLAQTFTTDAANELTGVTRTGAFTLSGATPAPATSVTVNGLAAQIYSDMTFAATNLMLANGQNMFTNIAQNVYGVTVTNMLTANLPVSVTLGYDLNGNLTNDGVHAFAFDAENQLTNATVAGVWKTEFVYDGLNRRRVERDYSWNGSAWIKTTETSFIFDGYLPVQERDTNNNVHVTYTRGLDISGSLSGAGGISGLLARTDSNGSTFYHADGAGNITALMDAQENMVGRYLYNPFGKLTGMWGSMAAANRMQFSSMPSYSWGAGFWGRFWLFDPQRWANNDPLGELGGINLTAGMNNNPVNFVDPYGLWWGQGAYNSFGDWELSLWDKAFVGGGGPAGDPNSQGVLSANAGYGFHDLTANGDPNGERLGNPASAVLGSVAGSLVDFGSLFVGGGEAKGLKCEARNLQKIFDKHGADFGLTGNWNPSRLMDVVKALGSHVDDPAVQKIPGTYRGIPGINYVNPATGANVFTDTSGNVIGAWKLGSDQLQSVLKTGRLF